MEITIHIRYFGAGDNARQFAREMEHSGIADAIRREEGNLRYEYFLPMSNPEAVLLIDTWESQQALDRHHASVMMERIAALRQKYDLHMQVERYIPDQNGIPETDRRFILP